MPRPFAYIVTGLLSCCLFIQKNLYAQDSTVVILKPVFVQASAFYDFPRSFGATAGINIPFRQITRSKDRIAGFDLGFYRYKFNHSGVIFYPYIGTRKQYHNGCYLESALGAGILNMIYDGRVYTVDDNGMVKRKKYAGRLYGTFNLSFAWGVNLAGNSKRSRFTLELKPMLWFQFPYNGFLLPHGSLSLGVKYSFTNVRLKDRFENKY